MVEVAHKHNVDLPAVRVFVKASAGSNGLGRPSAGAVASFEIPLNDILIYCVIRFVWLLNLNECCTLSGIILDKNFDL